MHGFATEECFAKKAGDGMIDDIVFYLGIRPVQLSEASGLACVVFRRDGFAKAE